MPYLKYAEMLDLRFYYERGKLLYADQYVGLFLQIFKEREEDLRRLSRPLECSCFRTSIWDETLYKVCIFL